MGPNLLLYPRGATEDFPGGTAVRYFVKGPMNEVKQLTFTVEKYTQTL